MDSICKYVFSCKSTTYIDYCYNAGGNPPSSTMYTLPSSPPSSTASSSSSSSPTSTGSSSSSTALSSLSSSALIGGFCTADADCNGFNVGSCQNALYCNDTDQCTPSLPVGSRCNVGVLGGGCRCAVGNYCNGTMCVSKLADGTPCVATWQCASNNCDDTNHCGAAISQSSKEATAAIAGSLLIVAILLPIIVVIIIIMLIIYCCCWKPVKALFKCCFCRSSELEKTNNISSPNTTTVTVV